MTKRSQVKRSRKSNKSKSSSIFTNKFKHAMHMLNRLTPAKRRVVTNKANNVFIRDISSALKKIRGRPHLVKGNHRNVLKKHRNKLRRLVSAKVSIKKKRSILTQKGGIIPALIPVICAAIAAAGTTAAGIGGAAVHAAISA